MRWLLLLSLFLGLCVSSPAFAQTSPDEYRAREIGAQLRCVVCQNQSIEDSDAQLAKDMRRIVREQLATGATNEEVISHIRDSYGDYVLLKPPVQSNTYVLWAFPFVLVFVSFIWWLSTARQREIEPPESELSDKDKALLSSLMEDAP